MAISVAALMSVDPQLDAFFGCRETKLEEVSDGHIGGFDWMGTTIRYQKASSI